MNATTDVKIHDLKDTGRLFELKTKGELSVGDILNWKYGGRDTVTELGDSVVRAKREKLINGPAHINYSLDGRITMGGGE